MFKHLPNILTVTRIPLTGLFIYLLLQAGLQAKVWAAAVFVLASLTDYADGYLARKYKLHSDFGKLMDPITDKILTLSAFGSFAGMHVFPWWMFWIVAGREVGITAFRLWANTKGIVLAAEMTGKWKTVLQMVTIIGILIFVIITEMGMIQVLSTELLWLKGIFVAMLAVVVLTLQSGLSVLAGSLVKFRRRDIMSLSSKGFTRFLATGAYMGYMPKLPGTFASLVMCVVVALWHPSHQMLVVTLFEVIFLGLMVCGSVEKSAGRKDPSFIVIDEIAGVLVSFAFLPVINWQVAVLVFIVFRYFDITKVLGIRNLEAAGGATGIMLDDILAGVYTNAVLQILFLGWRMV